MDYNDRRNRAEALIQQDRYVEALREYATLFKEKPDDPINIERFTFLFDRIIDGSYDFEPENADQFVMRGVARFYRNEIEDSIEDYDRAIKLDPNHHYALKSKAFSLKFLGRFEEAIASLNNAIRIQPTGEYYDDLADVYILMGKRDIAFEYHKRAVECSPNEARLWYNYGFDLAQNGLLKEAVDKFDKAIELWPDYEDAILNRQQVLDHLKKSG